MTDGWYGWALAIRRVGTRRSGAQWHSAFRESCSQLAYPIDPMYFDPDGQMYDHGIPVGRYRFVELDEARAAFGRRAWFRLDAPCPWVDRVAGFLDVHWWCDAEARRFDAERLLGAAHGFVVRLRDDAVFDLIARNTYRLGEANEKHGFGDGDDFLDAGPAYEAYVWGTITAALREHGLRAERITYGTSHNRMRFDELAVLHGSPDPAPAWARFAAHRDRPLEIWAHARCRDELARVLED
jgi:hypothetical protein